MKLTLHDIARAAGVSKSTVSRALNNDVGISATTRQNVLETCQRLGFRRNSSARALKTGKTNRIIVLIEDIRGPWAAEIVAGVSQMALRHSYEPILVLGDSMRTHGLRPQIASNGIEGIIYVAGYHVTEVQLPLDEWQIPAVCAYSVCSTTPSVIPDDRHGGYIATKSLVDRGHQHIAVIMGPSTLQPSLDRVKGFAELRPNVPEAFIAFGEWTFNDGYAQAARLLQQHPEITAFFAGDDHIAAGILSAARDRGRSVPEDLAVVGFNDSEIARHIRPNIASVRMPLTEIGQQAAQELFALLSDESPSSDRHCAITKVTCELIERESLGLAPLVGMVDRG